MRSYVSLSNPRRVWSTAETDPCALAEVVSGVEGSRELARMLVGRGVRDGEQARAFLDAELDEVWRDPDTIPGMADAADAVTAAITAGKRILVFGDFDVDGITAAAVATLGLKMYGGTGAVIVPNRFTDGYGFTDESVTRILAASPELVVTVDCGVSGAQQVARLRAAGVDVVVTDHHEPGDAVPVAVPVADPKLGDYPFPELAGVGVALKLVAAVGKRLGAPQRWRELTDLAAIGTVADIVPLLDENRALVATGLRRTRIAPRPGVEALAEVAGVPTASITADRVAFALAPRINAAGRMADPRIALRLLLAPDVEAARPLALELEKLNRERQAVEGVLFEEAEAQAIATLRDGDRALVLAGEGWHDGVKGIVASRLAGRYGLPTLMFCLDGDQARGSGRSVADVDLFGAVTSCSDLLGRFGGHKQAVGLSLGASDLPAFRRRLAETLEALPDEAFSVRRTLDAELTMAEVTPAFVRELRALEPHGLGNPKPLFVAPAVVMRGAACVGKDAGHLRFEAEDGTSSVKAIAFRCDDIEARLGHEGTVGLVFEIEPDDFRGRNGVQLLVRDFVQAV